MYVYRTRFKKEIVTEFSPPDRPSRRVVILCPGMPSLPGGKDDLLRFFSRKGYWAFLLRYRGSWESGGRFLKKSPHQDVTDVIDGLPKGFREAWGGKRFAIKDPEVLLIGSSFGGPAALLASTHPAVRKVIALSPVADWKKLRYEPVLPMLLFVTEGFGQAYRSDRKDWKKLSSGGFYDPSSASERIAGAKALIIHAHDDRSVEIGPAKALAKRVSALFVPLARGGHLSLSAVLRPKFWKTIAAFIKKK